MSAPTPPPPAADHPLRLSPAQLRWRCDPEQFSFETTKDVEPIHGVVGQDDAIEALRFGLEVHAPGQNIFVRGLHGTGRLRLVERLLGDIQPACPVARDRCYVRNFKQPDRPRLISLPRGRGRRFKERIEELIEYIRSELIPALSTEDMRTRRKRRETELRQRLEARSKSFDEELSEAGLGIINLRQGEQANTAIVPLYDGQPAPPERFEALVAEGKVSAQEADAIREKLASFRDRFQRVNEDLHELQNTHRGSLREMFESEARRLLELQLREIRGAYACPEVDTFLDEIVDDVVNQRLATLEAGEADPTDLYRVNVLHSQDEPGCPVVVENTPTMQNLLGSIDRVVLPNGGVITDHTMISAGSLLQAEGGFLILDVRDLLSEPGAWKVLVRTLRTGRLEIVPHDMGLLGSASLLKPEPIDVNVKVVLIGDPNLYYLLDANDPDFPMLFKVLADFDSELPRDASAIDHYAGVLSGLAERESLPPFRRDAVALLCEYGARIAGRNDRLTMRFGRLWDVAREAAYLTMHDDPAQPLVIGKHVREAVNRSRKRADRPSRRFRENIADGTIRIQTSGTSVGQVNGLAVMQAGPLTFGFPARITATIGAGSRGMIDIEGASSLGGRIHTKGFQILQGLLRTLLPTEHPLTFSASLAFEQSYGGVDGDSASGAEMCCLLSALTGIPLRQSLAMTGAIDQFGNIQPIGGASEKIEGFFSTCSDAGLTGDQGVILPRANIRNLMLREELVEACEKGRFHVFAVDRIEQALELFTGMPAGQLQENGDYPEGTLLHMAMDRAHSFWGRMSAKFAPAAGADDEAADAEATQPEPAGPPIAAE